MITNKQSWQSGVVTVIDLVVRFFVCVFIPSVGSSIVQFVNADNNQTMITGYCCISLSVYIMKKSRYLSAILKGLK